MDRLSYRTEIVIPPDRTVLLHLPAHLPEGRAVVVVRVDEGPEEAPSRADFDGQEIEWWDEFEDGPAEVDRPAP